MRFLLFLFASLQDVSFLPQSLLPFALIVVLLFFFQFLPFISNEKENQIHSHVQADVKGEEASYSSGCEIEDTNFEKYCWQRWGHIQGGIHTMKDIRTQESYTRRVITHGGTHTQSDTHGGIHTRRNTLIPPSPSIIKLPKSFLTTLKSLC